MKKSVAIVDYRSELRPLFEQFNREWLEKYFRVEPVDELYFRDPENEILKKGGEIFFVEYDGEIVGTAAIVPDGDALELAKMGVTPSAQGLGLGEMLVKEAVLRAKRRGQKSLFLVTNSNLVAAVGLYKKLGFKETFRGQHPKYARGDLVMEITFEE